MHKVGFDGKIHLTLRRRIEAGDGSSGQALSRVRESSSTTCTPPVYCGVSPGQQDRDAGRPRRRGGDRGGGQRPEFLPPQGPRRSRDLLRGRRAAPHRRARSYGLYVRSVRSSPLVERQPSRPQRSEAETGTARHQGLPAYVIPPARRGAHRHGGIRACNRYIETERDLVVVTARPRVEDKIATCLSQLYDHQQASDPATRSSRPSDLEPALDYY